MAAEYVAREGNERIVLCERGIKTFERTTRYTLDLGSVAVLKHETHLPVIVDPSHAAGRRDLVLPLARAAAAVGRGRDHRRVAPARPRRRSATGRSRSRPRSSASSPARCGRWSSCSASASAEPVEVERLGDRRHGPDRRVRRARGEARGRRRTSRASTSGPEALRGRTRARRGRRARAARSRRARRRRPRRRRRARRAARHAGACAAARRRAATATVTDVGSTKARRLRGALGDPRFVGGHPVCGSEAHGPAHATRRPVRRRDLVPDAVDARPSPSATGSCTASSPRSARRRSRSTREAHDRLVALTSHLPHALANLLVNQAGATRDRGPRAARGGRRLAARHDARRRREPAHLGRHLPRERGALRESLAEHRRRIEQLEARARRGRRAASSRAGSARPPDNRRRMLADAFPDPGDLQQLRVHVPDRPGVLAGITQALGAERINIEDFELHHVSPERGGTLTLLVTGEGEARARGRAARVAGLRRRRLAGAGGMKIEPAARAARPHRRARRQVDLAPRRAARRDRRRRDRRARLRPLRRHRVDDRRGARARRRRWTRTTSTRCASTASACAGLREPDAPIDCGNSGTHAAAARRDPRRASRAASS